MAKFKKQIGRWTDGDKAALIAAAPEPIAALCDDVERLRARKAEVCDCVHGTGMIGETLAYIDADCPKCGGSGAAIVEGEK